MSLGIKFIIGGIAVCASSLIPATGIIPDEMKFAGGIGLVVWGIYSIVREDGNNEK